MKYIDSAKIAYKKWTHKISKSFGVSVPIAFMVAIVLIVTAESKSIISVAEKSVFEALKKQNEVFEVSKETDLASQVFSRFRPSEENSEDSTFTELDSIKISGIKNVDEAILVEKYPFRNVVAQNLLSENFKIKNLSEINETFAKYFTDENFSSSTNEAIPIILSANDFSYTYEDFGVQTEIVNTFNRTPGQEQQLSPEEIQKAMMQNSPVKTKNLDYSIENLIGKTFEIEFESLDKISGYTISRSPGTTIYTKISSEEILAKEEARKTDLSQYFDFEKLTTPIKLNFKVVAIIEDENFSKSFVPTGTLEKVLEQIFERERIARNQMEISADNFAVYQGLVFDGTYLKDDPVSLLFSGVSFEENQRNLTFKRTPEGGGRGGFRRLMEGNSGYFIPGLIYKKNDDGTISEISNENLDFSLESTTIMVKINDAQNKNQVLEDLNKLGYPVKSNDTTDQINKLKENLNNTINLLMVIFMTISGIFIVLTMGKFVSDSTREIGIFRALGASKKDIAKIFLSQSILFVLVGYIVGVLFGIFGTISLSFVMQSQVSEIINSIIGSSISGIPATQVFDFLKFDFQKFGIYTIVLFVSSIIFSLIPANNASKVSPIKAIKN
ncbi:MAG: hypothetical protein Fur0024_2890 [Patescibacteria group bacterium]